MKKLLKRLMFGTPVKGTPVGSIRNIDGTLKVNTTYPTDLPRLSQNEWYAYVYNELTGSRK